MKAQYSACSLSFLSTCLALQSFFDVGYDLCASNSIISSINPLCTRPQEPSLQLPILDGYVSKPDELLSETHYHYHGEELGAWSLPPKCVHRHNETSKYCVYTSRSFAGNRGISVFANSEHGHSYPKLQGFTDPKVLEGSNADTDPRFISQPVPGKGLGLVALKPIRRGEELFRSTPVLIFEDSIDDNVEENDRRSFYNLAVRQLPKTANKRFHDLMGHFGGDEVEDKVNTNCFAVEQVVRADGETVPSIAVFPEMSRMNHDCRPNAHYYFDSDTLIQHVHALRTILPGEEITISYINVAQTSEDRKDALHTSWGFPCGCNACNAHQPVRSASDSRVEEIQRLHTVLTDYSASSPIADAETGTRVADLLVELYKLEGMLGPISEAYTLAAIEYNSAQRRWEALRFANMAIEAGLLYGGPKDPDVRTMMELVEAPEKHWSWDYRARTRWEATQGARS